MLYVTTVSSWYTGSNMSVAQGQYNRDGIEQMQLVIVRGGNGGAAAAHF